MKIVHAADLHLDSPLRGLPDYDGAPVAEVRSATRRAFTALVDLCLDQHVQLLVVAGDLYDGDFRDYSTALFFAEQVSRLREIDARVVWIRGNHDAQSRMTRHLRLSEGVHELSADRAETRVFEEWGVAVHGQGYATRDVVANLARAYPAALPGLFNVGVLHTALDGRVGHAPYAPCTTTELRAHGYDYWALGHVHQREVIATEPYVVFPGNLQGRHARETGPKGATWLSLDDGKLVDVRHESVDVVRWSVIDVDVRDVNHFIDVVDVASAALSAEQDRAEGRTLAARVRLLGATRLHGELKRREDELLAELRRHSIESGGIYLEKIETKTRGEIALETLALRGDAMAGLFQSLQALRDDPEALDAFRSELERPLAGVGAELLREEMAEFDEILREAESLLEGHLLDATPEDEL